MTVSAKNSFVLVLVMSTAASATCGELNDRFRTALNKIAPSIVRIETIGGALPVRKHHGEEGEVTAVAEFRQGEGPTTGVIWSTDGYIVTSRFNFMRDPSIITVRLADGRSLLAKLVARDFVAGLALLKVNARDLPTCPRTALTDVRPGQWALAAGFGHGAQAPALTVGIVSGLRRTSGLTIQTDCKLSPANYGGPLFDIEGRLVGVCVPNAAQGEADESAGVEWYDSGIGFAAHVDALTQRVPRLAAGVDWRRGLLGVEIDPAEPVVGRESPAGVRVIGVAGPAEEAGIREGDVISRIADAPTPSPTAFKRALAQYPAGDPLEVTIRREDATEHIITIRLASGDELRAATSQPTSQPASQPVTR